MTCVAYDGKSIAADRLSTWNNEPIPHPSNKIRLLRDGNRRFVVAHSGEQAQAYRLLWHHLHGERIAGVLMPYQMIGDERCSLMVLELLPESCHRCTIVGYGGDETDVTDAKATIGSGGDYAMGAMHAGSDAGTAVQIASQLNTQCGNGVTSYTLAYLQSLPVSGFASIREG